MNNGWMKMLLLIKILDNITATTGNKAVEIRMRNKLKIINVR